MDKMQYLRTKSTSFRSHFRRILVLKDMPKFSTRKWQSFAANHSEHNGNINMDTGSFMLSKMWK